MCGRYAASRRPEDLVEEFEVTESLVAAPKEEPGDPVRTDDKDADRADPKDADRADPRDADRADPKNARITQDRNANGGDVEVLGPSWNVAPTNSVAVVLERRNRDDPDGPAKRQLRAVRWGLVPSWAKDPSIGSRMINARTESVAEKPAFRKAFATRRCLVPADGYYEWYTPESADDAPSGGGRGGRRKRPPKQPFFISPRDGGVLAMAGLYEIWRDRSRAEDDPRAWLWTCTILTTTAEDDLGRIHDRMPMLVEKDRYSDWLDPARSDPDELRSLLVPAAPGRLQAVAVSTTVNNVRNNGPQLVEPIPLEEAEVPAGGRAATDEQDGRRVTAD